MRLRLRTLRLRDVFTVVAVGAVVAIAVVVVGRELGIGRQAAATLDESHQAAESTEAPDQAKSTLTLTLEASPYCETGGGVGFSGSVFEYDDDGNPVGRTTVYHGYGRIAETSVRWSVTGGTAPYALTIDNEPRDGRGLYEGASGVASVSCAPNPGEVFYDDYEEKRRYREDPMFDSGPKAIRAVVTDAAGATAVASIDIYVILQLGGAGTMRGGVWHQYRLNAGKTYRYEGHLFTIPESITLLPGAAWDGDGGRSGQTLKIEGTDSHIHIDRHGEEITRSRALSISQDADALSGAESDAASINKALDEFIASRGKPPTVNPNE